MPEADPRARSGALLPIVEYRSGSVSRAYAEIRISGADVVLVDSHLPQRDVRRRSGRAGLDTADAGG